MRDQMEVGTAFAARHVSGEYPDRYSQAFAFSILLYPHLPKGRHYGLTEFHADDMKGLGAVFSPVVLEMTYPECKTE
jgi:hypothetical protein